MEAKEHWMTVVLGLLHGTEVIYNYSQCVKIGAEMKNIQRV